MHVLDANEIFGMTFYTANRIIETWGKRWADALALYVKLLAQTRIQKTNQTFTLNKFLEDYFWWWHERLAKTKNVLKELWLIDDVVIRWENGKLKWHYVRVNFLVDEEKIRTSGITYNITDSLENRQSVSTTCGEMATNALSNKHINAWSNKLKNICQESEETVTRNKTWTSENKERFETFRKIYPHYQSRSRKKDAKTHFLERDYNEMMFSVKMLKRETIIHPDKAQYVPWCHKRVNNFTPMSDYQKKQAIRELYMRHRAAGWDMKTRMEDIVRDFPNVDFSEFREELSRKKTEYALWDLIPKK